MPQNNETSSEQTTQKNTIEFIYPFRPKVLLKGTNPIKKDSRRSLLNLGPEKDSARGDCVSPREGGVEPTG